MTRCLGIVLAAACVVATAPSSASAYHPLPGFHQTPEQGGSARIYFTGSPRWDGMDCGTCHVDAPREVRYELTSFPAELFDSGRYQPGQTYEISIVMTNAMGLTTWAMEVLDDDLTPVGNYVEILGCRSPQGEARACLQPSCTFLCKNDFRYREACAPDGAPICNVVRQIPGCESCTGGDGCGCDNLDGVAAGSVFQPWAFEFVAPPAGTGPITMYFGGVVGTSDHASTGDDYEMQVHRLCEGATDCAEPPASNGEPAGDYEPTQSVGGCTASGHATPLGALFALAFVAAGTRRRRRDRE